MPPYLLSGAIWSALWPLPFLAGITTLVMFLIGRPRFGRRKLFAVVFSFSLLGVVIGTLAGFSRQPALGAVLPAVLSLVGGLAIYLIGAKKADQGLVAVCVIGLTADLMVGATWGASLRDGYEQSFESVEFKQREALKEVRIIEFRRELGLPDYPPILAPKAPSPATQSKDP